jgi:NIMA (never in mitosis gene a)-related kinase
MQAAHRELPNLWQSEYVLDRELGRGAFGVARLARKQGKLVVVKQINLAKQGPKEREVAYQEAQVLKQFCHNNVIRFIDAEVAAANLFIVMEYADGGDLSERIAQRKRRVSSPYFVESYVCHILAQIVLALRHIHRHRILHRDLKPQVSNDCCRIRRLRCK